MFHIKKRFLKSRKNILLEFEGGQRENENDTNLRLRFPQAQDSDIESSTDVSKIANSLSSSSGVSPFRDPRGCRPLIKRLYKTKDFACLFLMASVSVDC